MSGTTICKPDKVDNLEYCLRNLVAIDATPVSSTSCDAESLLNLSRDNTQLLVNRIFSLNRVTTSDGVFVSLPEEDAITMPRMYPLPKPKKKTRWQLFAEARGIKKHKRSRLVFDKAVNDWVPRWGYKSIKKGLAHSPPIVEVRDSDLAQGIDPFEESSRKKGVQKTRQKLRELRNKAEASALSRANTALQRAKTSTRSCGKFDKKTKGVKAKATIRRKAVNKPLKEERKSYLESIRKLNLTK
ncbi:Ribosome biogenesis regulatory -like protein [Babesia sp. Xinjiang]|uniref:Ribosome biogenesis regulatory -like protein n=1 Tax=Babesia sp. Xinjiang TaxID=462227 RepID=UPI000A21ED36|nr:Ribosome biogenesis regulatory -like protein [Babesia sp. Xinjiang]ORM42026.1 Ribosome biogenesis regulatory -like protein [Babesia sp. Xinjiang]